jgi:hypothetical protein
VVQVVDVAVVQEAYHPDHDAGDVEALHDVHHLYLLLHQDPPDVEGVRPYEAARIPSHARVQRQAIQYHLPELIWKYRGITVYPLEYAQGKKKHHCDEATIPIDAWNLE